MSNLQDGINKRVPMLINWIEVQELQKLERKEEGRSMKAFMDVTFY